MKKEDLRRQQRKKIEHHKVEASIEASKVITQRCMLLSEVNKAKSIFVYASMQTEVSTDDLIRLFLKQGKHVVIPKVLKKGVMVPSEINFLEELSIGHLGFREPQELTPFKDVVDVVIVPGLAFDQHGNRLGSGGGYYDRYFAAFPSQFSIGLSFQRQILAEIPSESHDHQIDIILTEECIYR